MGNKSNEEEICSAWSSSFNSPFIVTFDLNDSPGGNKVGADFGAHCTDEKTETQRMNQTQDSATGSVTQSPNAPTVGSSMNFT